MADESRKDPRASVPGIRATYERPDGEAADDEVLNFGRGGVFIATTKPIAVAKLIHVEVHLPGDPMPIAATGRVVWTRDVATANDRPAGIGVRFVDVDEGALEVLARLAREHAPSKRAAMPQRERTILGVAPASNPPPPLDPAAAPVSAPAAAPVPAEAQAAPVEAKATEAQKTPADKPMDAQKTPPAKQTEAQKAPAKPAEKRGGGAGWFVVLLLLAAGAVLLFWDRIAPLLGK